LLDLLRITKVEHMKRILILGAGLSASSLIRYLLQNAQTYNWEIRVVDQDITLVNKKLDGHNRGVALCFNALNRNERKPEIAKADLVISMLPARFHSEVAKDCIELKRDLITPSYISKEMLLLHDKALEAGIVIMNEIGVDPGIDHMSAMKMIHGIKAKGGKIEAFRSYCGGLIAPESDTNPWNYKFTWNPRNVVVAGQGSPSCFLDHNEFKYIPYNRLFNRLIPLKIDGYGDFEAYANRDSLSYRRTYGLEDIPTIFRGTLRRPGFCEAWNVFIELGMTDDTFTMERSESLSPRNFLNAFLPYHATMSVEEKFRSFLRTDRQSLFNKFKWLGLFDNTKAIGLRNATPAQLLEFILKDKWVLNPEDKDMLVMYHEFEYSLNSKRFRACSSMVNIGEDQVYTSMSNTVGLPVAIAAKRILEGTLNSKGVVLPVQPENYEPILSELALFGIIFNETEAEI
jgi:saccharopine dehydrogenase-like NADP-dependent oxidoreductase